MKSITRAVTVLALIFVSTSAVAAPVPGSYAGTMRITSRLGAVENSSRSKVGVRFELDGSFIVLTESRPNTVFNSNDLVMRGRIDAANAVTLQDSTDFFSQSYRGTSQTTTTVVANQLLTTTQMTFQIRTGRFIDLPNSTRAELTKTIVLTVTAPLR